MASIMQLSSVSRRSISTSLRAPLQATKPTSISRIARRGYADAAPTPSPAPQPKKRFRALRWAWRLTWLSAIGLTGYVAYSILELRQPPEQFTPDPEKKTLVILGMFQSQSPILPGWIVANMSFFCRNWLGIRFPLEEN
jgi:NADH:ubiquinone reductase (non-electrogenic)